MSNLNQNNSSLRSIDEDQPPALHLVGLSKVFGGTIAVDQIELDVPRGSFFGLVGHNGAGKTTTLRALGGMVRTTGSILLDGVRIVCAFHNRSLLSGRVRRNNGLALVSSGSSPMVVSS